MTDCILVFVLIRQWLNNDQWNIKFVIVTEFYRWVSFWFHNIFLYLTIILFILWYFSLLIFLYLDLDFSNLIIAFFYFPFFYLILFFSLYFSISNFFSLFYGFSSIYPFCTNFLFVFSSLLFLSFFFEIYLLAPLPLISLSPSFFLFLSHLFLSHTPPLALSLSFPHNERIKSNQSKSFNEM